MLLRSWDVCTLLFGQSIHSCSARMSIALYRLELHSLQHAFSAFTSPITGPAHRFEYESIMYENVSAN